MFWIEKLKEGIYNCFMHKEFFITVALILTCMVICAFSEGICIWIKKVVERVRKKSGSKW